jgi:hypothetical protein
MVHFQLILTFWAQRTTPGEILEKYFRSGAKVLPIKADTNICTALISHFRSFGLCV